MLEQFANISEIAGTAIVIITLVFLVVQIRQSTQAMKSSTALALTTRLAENYRVLALDKEISAFTLLGSDDPEKLDSAGRARYTAWMIHVALNFQDLYFQSKNQAYDKEQYEGFMRLFAQLSKSPGFKLFWKSRKFMFSKSFQLFVDEGLDNYYVESNYSFLDSNSEHEQ